MKSVSVSTPMKAGAIVLLTLLLFTAVLSGLGTAYLAVEGAYDGSGTAFEDSVLCDTLASQLRRQALYLCDWSTVTPTMTPAVTPVPEQTDSAAPDPQPTTPTSQPAVTPAPDPQPTAPVSQPAVTPAPDPQPAAPTLEQAGLTLEQAPHAGGTYVHFSIWPEGELPSDAIVSFVITDAERASLDALFDPARTNYRLCLFDVRTGEQLYGPDRTEGLMPLQNGAGLAQYDDATGRYLGGIRVADYLDPSLSASDSFAFFRPVYERMHAWRYALPVICLVSLLLSALVYAYLLCAAGRHPGEEAVRPGVFDRIPTDVFYALILALGVCAGLLFAAGFELTSVLNGQFMSMLVLAFLFGIIASVVLLLLFILLSMSTAVRVKTHTFLSSALTVRLIRRIFRGVRSLFGMIAALLKNLPVLWKLLLGAAGYGLLTVLMTASRDGFFVFLWLVASIAAILLLCRSAVGLDRLRRGTKAIAGGDLAYAIDTKYLPHDEREMAADLSNISAGIGRAVEERMKSERMKTDLITNVSHDLKTPLTSIVNYVDLLKKEELHNETAAGYVAVLDRQAQKLKKLTEDIVEASKASSGVLNVNLAPTDAAELLRQCAAEYAERFAAADLTPMLRIPADPVMASADGRLLWRVFDNLLGNVVKYAMPGTRVYLDAAADSTGVTLSVRNISKEPLEKSGDELMERFVRGDASRHAEGSGLGLAIAASLTALQGGTLTILPDGDLFRADVRLNR